MESGVSANIPQDYAALHAGCAGYSAASLWEIALKRGLGRPDFQVDSRRVWRMLPLNGYRELPVTGEHGIAVENPAIAA